MKKNKKKDIYAVSAVILGIAGVMLFNYLIDPYYIFKNEPLKGVNDKKPHLYTNRRQIINADMKLNGRSKTSAFIGDCALYRVQGIPFSAAFYAVPVTSLSEIKNTVLKIQTAAPDIKTIYFGLSFNEIADKNGKTKKINGAPEEKNSLKDIINLFFSWNTVKYSLETVKTSLAGKSSSDEYVYPYREAAGRNYPDLSFNDIDLKLKEINEIKETAEKNGIKTVFYAAPSNINYKVYLFEKGLWDKYIYFKQQLAKITDYYDYSLNNDYNIEPLDGSGIYYIDTIHITEEYGRKIINELLTGIYETGVLINKDNAEQINEKDAAFLKDYISTNKTEAEKIRSLKPGDADIKVKRKAE